MLPATEPAAATAPAATTAPTTAAAVPTTLPANPALAERIVSIAGGLLRAPSITPGMWRYASGLLEAAARLAPAEIRYLRLLSEAASRSGDSQAYVDALTAWTRLDPRDQVVQVQLIDAHLSRIDGLDSKVEYLRGLIAAPNLAPPVRSAAAVRCALLVRERMQENLADKLIDQALSLNRLNLDALRIKYQESLDCPADQQLQAMLALLRSNPAQPTIVVEVARTLSAAGLVQRGLEWYVQGLDLHRRMGITPAPEVGLDYGAELFIAGDTRGAAVVADRLTTSNPDDLNAWMLKLIIAKQSGQKEILAQTLGRTVLALTNRLAMIRQAAGDTTATTRPIDFAGELTLPDPAADMQRLAKQPQLLQQYAQVAAAIAWIKIYFEEKPGQVVGLVKAVASAMGESNEVVARLQGWSFLIAGNKDDARVKLTAAAEHDPVAGLGLIRLLDQDPAAKQKVADEGAKVLAQTPAGLTGALIIAELGPRGVKPRPGPESAKLEKIAGEFPKEWMQIIDQPQTFYTIRMSPVRVEVPTGEPVLVQVTVQNIGAYPLTVGPEGVIHPDLWLDAQLRGVQQRVFPAEAYSRLTGAIVLEPRDYITQVVRLDQSELANELEKFPQANFQISAMVMTNPATLGGQITLGPAGNKSQLSTLMQRTGVAINQDPLRQKLGLALQNGTAAEKVQTVETLTKFAQLLSGEGGSDVAKQLSAQAGDAVRRTVADPDPAVHAWATYLFARLTGDRTLLTGLLKEPTWVARVLGIVAVDYMGENRDLVRPLAQSDPDPLVKKIAAASIAANLQRPAATQPAAQPATQPAPTPAPAAAPATKSPAAATPPAK
jgi:tetratricopeptide (TPR) repeat protein